MKTYLILSLFVLNSFAFAKNPYIWVASSFSSETFKLKGELTNYIKKLSNRIESDYKDNVGFLEGFYDFGGERDYSRFYPVNSKSQINTGDLIIHFSGLTINCESKIYTIFINYFVIDACNLWAWVTYDNTIFYSEQPEQRQIALNTIYDDINKRIKVYLNQNLMNDK